MSCRCGSEGKLQEVRFEGNEPVSVCSSCAAEWVQMKQFFWAQFVDPPKYREPRGLSAAQMAERGMLDGQRRE